MGYYLKEQPIPSHAEHVAQLIKAIALTALLYYKRETHANEDEATQVRVNVLERTVEVEGLEIRHYTFDELGFKASA